MCFLVKILRFFFVGLWLFVGFFVGSGCSTEPAKRPPNASPRTSSRQNVELNMQLSIQQLTLQFAIHNTSLHFNTSTVSVNSVSLTLWFLLISSFLISPKSKEIRCLSTTYRLIDFWGLFFSSARVVCFTCSQGTSLHHTASPSLLKKSLSSSFEGAFLASRQKSGHSTSCVSYSCHEVNKRP